jgi:hypothetical protein
MTRRDREDEYETQYQSATANGSNADTDLIVVETDKQAQLSNIQIDGNDAQDYVIEVRDQDGSNASTKRRYFAVSNVDRGDFENPELEWGAKQEIAVVNRTALSAEDYSVNVTVDEHTGK